MAIETVSAVKQNDKRTYWEISSQDVENYIQTRLEAVRGAYKQNGIHLPDSVSDCKIVTATGRNFAIFIGLFDTSILYDPRERDLAIDGSRVVDGKTVPGKIIEPTVKGGGKKRISNNSGVNIIDLAERDDNDSGVKIRRGFYTVLNSYQYSAEASRDLFKRNVDRNLARTVKDRRGFSIEKLNGEKLVITILNPVEVFYAMLQDKNNKNQDDYLITILGIKKISGSNYQFDIERRRRTGKKTKGRDLTKSILDRLSK